MDGFDISHAQFPPKEWLPSNVHLYTHDVFEPFPAEFHQAYDVVHVRFFMTLVNNESLGPLIRTLMTLLSMCISSHLHELRMIPYLSWRWPRRLDVSEMCSANIKLSLCP